MKAPLPRKTPFRSRRLRHFFPRVWKLFFNFSIDKSLGYFLPQTFSDKDVKDSYLDTQVGGEGKALPTGYDASLFLSKESNGSMY